MHVLSSLHCQARSSLLSPSGSTIAQAIEQAGRPAQQLTGRGRRQGQDHAGRGSQLHHCRSAVAAVLATAACCCYCWARLLLAAAAGCLHLGDDVSKRVRAGCRVPVWGGKGEGWRGESGVAGAGSMGPRGIKAPLECLVEVGLGSECCSSKQQSCRCRWDTRAALQASDRGIQEATPHPKAKRRISSQAGLQRPRTGKARLSITRGASQLLLLPLLGMSPRAAWRKGRGS